jgi:ADP-ribosylation factor-binding protein GGA
MEEEEREAQSAKLQELIRRGSPEDLQEANRLMKIMAGYDVRSKTDYRAKAAEDVAKVQAKARLLEERLESFRPGSGDKIEDGDVFGELAAALRNAQPKIQKMCEDESEDHDAVAKLFDINDSIHRTLQRYEHMKNGDFEAASRVLGGSTEVTGIKPRLGLGGGEAKELSLIDLDAEPDAYDPYGAPEDTSAYLENDLLGLSIGMEGMGTNETERGGGIALPLDITDQSHRTAPFIPPPTSQLGSPGLLLQQQKRQSRFTCTSATESNPNGQLASLASLESHQQSLPVTTHDPTNTPNAPTDIIDLPEDDEWSFSSALPSEPTHYKFNKHRDVINNTDLQIEFMAGRATCAPSISLSFAFTNNTTRPITELHYQLAVTKGFELQLKPQTGRALQPSQIRGVTQDVEVWHTGDRTRKVETIRLRWKATYKVGGDDRAETGEVPELKVG